MWRYNIHALYWEMGMLNFERLWHGAGFCCIWGGAPFSELTGELYTTSKLWYRMRLDDTKDLSTRIRKRRVHCVHHVPLTSEIPHQRNLTGLNRGLVQTYEKDTNEQWTRPWRSRYE